MACDVCSVPLCVCMRFLPPRGCLCVSSTVYTVHRAMPWAKLNCEERNLAIKQRFWFVYQYKWLTAIDGGGGNESKQPNECKRATESNYLSYLPLVSLSHRLFVSLSLPLLCEFPLDWFSRKMPCLRDVCRCGYRATDSVQRVCVPVYGLFAFARCWATAHHHQILDACGSGVCNDGTANAISFNNSHKSLWLWLLIHTFEFNKTEILLFVARVPSSVSKYHVDVWFWCWLLDAGRFRINDFIAKLYSLFISLSIADIIQSLNESLYRFGPSLSLCGAKLPVECGVHCNGRLFDQIHLNYSKISKWSIIKVGRALRLLIWNHNHCEFGKPKSHTYLPLHQ